MPWPPLLLQIQELIQQADGVFSQAEQDIRGAHPQAQAQDLERLTHLAARNLQAVKDCEGARARGCWPGTGRACIGPEVKTPCRPSQAAKMRAGGCWLGAGQAGSGAKAESECSFPVAQR